jgi:hypothetical protein
MTSRALRLWIELEDKRYGANVETLFSGGGGRECVLCGRTHKPNRGYQIDISTSPWVRRKYPEDIYKGRGLKATTLR